MCHFDLQATPYVRLTISKQIADQMCCWQDMEAEHHSLAQILSVLANIVKSDSDSIDSFREVGRLYAHLRNSSTCSSIAGPALVIFTVCLLMHVVMSDVCSSLRQGCLSDHIVLPNCVTN